MNLAILAIVLPFVAAAVLAAVPSWRLGGRINAGASALVFLLVCLLPWQGSLMGSISGGMAGGMGAIDPVGVPFAIITAFVAAGGALFALTDVPTELFRRTLDPTRARIFHVAYQGFLGAIMAALLADSLVLTWIATELAVIAAAVAIAVPRARAAVEASWSFFLVCGAGLALALFGMAVLYLAAAPAIGASGAVLNWSTLLPAAARCDGPLLNLAFVFLLLGYATLAGLAPMHAWVWKTSMEAPAPLVAILSCAMANVGLPTILRLRALMAANADAIASGPPIVALGLLSLLVAAFGAWRTPGLKRLFAFSAIGQSGVAAVAFGIGGQTAIFAGLLHLMLHTLVRAAAIPCVARTAQLKSTSVMADIRGLFASHRSLGLGLAGCMLALAAVPPSGLFASVFLILTDAVRQAPWTALGLGLGLVVMAAALITRLQPLCFGEPTRTLLGLAARPIELAPVWAPLAVVVVLGFAMPPPLFAWLHEMAAMVR